MKRRRKQRKPSLQPQVILVGNSGSICRNDRLCRLRMTKKYKNFLLEQENEKNAKVILLFYSIRSSTFLLQNSTLLKQKYRYLGGDYMDIVQIKIKPLKLFYFQPPRSLLNKL